MKLVSVTQDHLKQLMAWFPDLRSCRVWSGPDLRFPFTEATFRADTKWDEVPSFALVEEEGEMMGFGQYYSRAGRCHLARLVISPGHRGRGLGAILIRALWDRGRLELGFRECSLFVLADNGPAISLYTRLGFVPEVYPEPMPKPLGGCLYMVASKERKE